MKYQKLEVVDANNIHNDNENANHPIIHEGVSIDEDRVGFGRDDDSNKPYHQSSSSTSTALVTSFDHPTHTTTTTMISVFVLLFITFLVLVVIPGPMSVVLSSSSAVCTEPCVPGSEDIMKPKHHGTCPSNVQSKLRWDVDWDVTDRICCLNRRYAEYSGYWETTTFPSDVKQHRQNDDEEKTITFYDPVTGIPLFTAPRDRTWEEFLKESHRHGWPSFRDSEVNWDNVRVLPDGETVSVNGTHLGHNLPDGSGNRYCISTLHVCSNELDF